MAIVQNDILSTNTSGIDQFLIAATTNDLKTQKCTFLLTVLESRSQKLGPTEEKSQCQGTHSHGKYQGSQLQPWWRPAVYLDQGCLEEEYHRKEVDCKRVY